MGHRHAFPLDVGATHRGGVQQQVDQVVVQQVDLVDVEHPAVRGLQMKQLRPAPTDRVPDTGIDYQVDKVSADALGGRPTLLALEGWPELP